MPRGSYLVDGRPEAFSCAPGPAGWRYASDRLDLSCDAGSAVVRFAAHDPAGGWARGGRATLDDGRRLLRWTCGLQPGRERISVATAVLTGSPGSLVALLRAVAAPGEQPVRQDRVAVLLDQPGLAGRDVRRSVRRTGAARHRAPGGELLVETWTLQDPDTGEQLTVHLAGDVVLATAGAGSQVELSELSGPPSWSRW